MTNGIIVFILILHEFTGSLIDCVVGQMHEQVIQVIVIGRNVLVSCESRETFVVHVYPKRIHSTQENVDSEIEFKSLDKIGLVEVSLNDIVIVGIHVI